MDSDSFKTITDRGEGLYKEKGSKFIAIAFPVDSEEDVKQKLSEVGKQYFDARHHCYAYVL
ncbi:MAG: YigZ family protein, partial [Bacteroidales bacterium]|nr:YigZ family protein [Bacteroidales bacterium]